MARTCGTISCYQAGCHCPDCRRAAREHRARYRVRTRKPNRARQCMFCHEWFGNLTTHERKCIA